MFVVQILVSLFFATACTLKKALFHPAIYLSHNFFLSQEVQNFVSFVVNRFQSHFYG